MDANEIQKKMIEHRQHDVTRGETMYRWDLGIYHTTNRYDPDKGDEMAWLKMARHRAAAAIAKLMEKR